MSLVSVTRERERARARERECAREREREREKAGTVSTDEGNPPSVSREVRHRCRGCNTGKATPSPKLQPRATAPTSTPQILFDYHSCPGESNTGAKATLSPKVRPQAIAPPPPPSPFVTTQLHSNKGSTSNSWTPVVDVQPGCIPPVPRRRAPARRATCFRVTGGGCLAMTSDIRAE